MPGIARALVSLPLSHAFGLLVLAVGLHAREPGTTVLMRWFDPAAWLELAEEHRSQISAVVPSMLQLLLAQPLEEYDLSELRCVRSPTVMAGYWEAPEATAEVIRDGWLHTGDLGRLGEDGYLYITDRAKDLIIRGGFNVFPRDVEEALLEHPAVASAAVVGRPDETHGEEVVAFVTGDVAPDELVAFAKRRIGGYKYPREVHVLDALPLTPIGKVDRKALRAQLVD